MTPKSILIVMSIISITGGALFFAISHNIIIIRIPTHKIVQQPHVVLKKELMRFTYWKGVTRCHEWRHIMQDDQDVVTAQRIINTYWTLVEDAGLLPSRVGVQAVTTDRAKQTLLCSLSNSPFNTETSVLDAWLIIEGLILTLRELMPQFQKILLLANHKVLTHSGLDYSRPWPLEGFSAVAQFAENYTPPTLAATKNIVDQPLIVYINPSGNAYHAGRTIGDSFEHGIALNCAQLLKDELALRLPSARVIINHGREQHRDAVQHINQAHRIRANIYIHLSFYQSQQSTPELILTTFRWHPTTDLWKHEVPLGSFVPLHEAHFKSATTSHHSAQRMFHYAATNRPYPLFARAYLTLPYAPLAGLAIPAVGLEVGIQQAQQLADIVPALTDLIVEGCKALP